MAQTGRTFRIFVSSTFDDLKAERNALQHKVFPKLRKLCMQYGCRFQAIDLRWGVREEASRDQLAMKICLEELKRCQKVTPRPNFIVLLGDRYGWRPLPYEIPASEFEEIERHITDVEEKRLLNTWYKRDDNAVPPVYCLQRRTGKSVIANGVKQSPLPVDYEDHAIWEKKVERPLRMALLNAANKIDCFVVPPRNDDSSLRPVNEGGMSQSSELAKGKQFLRSVIASETKQSPTIDRLKYTASATEQEIYHGALKVPDAKEHVFCFFRKITNLDKLAGDAPHTANARYFVDVDENNKPDTNTGKQLTALKGTLSSSLAGNVHNYEAEWTGNGVTTSHIDKLCDDVYDALSRIILKELKEIEKLKEDQLKMEIDLHKGFGEERAKYFVGRVEVLKTIEDYIKGEKKHPMVMYGESGSGKTALMAEAVKSAGFGVRSAERRVISRFIGATPESSVGRSLLESLCKQIYRDFQFEEQKQQRLDDIKSGGEEGQKERQKIEEEYGIPSDFQRLSMKFQELLVKIPAERKLVLFLDALDQLSDADNARSLSWLPTQLPDNVKIIVSTLPGECLSALEKRLMPKSPSESPSFRRSESSITDHSEPPSSSHLESPSRHAEPSSAHAEPPSCHSAPPSCHSELPPCHSERSEESPNQIQKKPGGTFPPIIKLEPMPLEEGQILLDRWLDDKKVKRTLQPRQRSEVLNKFRQNGMPLYLKLAFDEARRWKSYTEDIELGMDIPGIIRTLFARLSSDNNHGGMLVTRSLGYLAAAKNGISEDEMLDVLSLDKDVFNDFRERARHEPPEDRLPIAVWSRLYFDLEPYLTERSADKTTLMTFYHRQLERFVSDELLKGEEKKKRHKGLAQYFEKEPLLIESDGKKHPHIRKVSELPYQQMCGEAWDDVEKTLCSLDFIEAKCTAGMTYELMKDYDVAMNEIPEGRAERETELEREREIQRYTREIVEYALKWSEARDLHTQDPVKYPMPAPDDIPLPKAIESVKPWTDKEIEADTQKIINNPTPLHKLKVFSQFVNGEAHNLIKYNSYPLFCIQQAYNSANAGPVYNAASKILENNTDAITILLKKPSLPPFNPHPGALRTLAGHTGSVDAVSLTPDGRRAVSGSWDETLRVWDVESGQCLRTLEGHTSLVTAVGLMPDGRRAVSGSWDKTLRVWDVESGQCLRTLKGHTDDVYAVSLMPDGRRAVSGSRDNMLRVWNLLTGKCLRILKGHTEWVRAVSLTPDGRRALSGSDDKKLRVWDVESGQCLRILKGHTEWVRAVSLTPGGCRAVSGSDDKTLRVWDVESGRCLRTLEGHTDCVLAVSLTSDGRRAVSGSRDNMLRVWNLLTGKCLRILKGHSSEIKAVDITPDSRRVVSGSEDRTLRVWNLQTGKCQYVLDGYSSWFKADFTTLANVILQRIMNGDRGLEKYLCGTQKGGMVLRVLLSHFSFCVNAVSITPDGSRAVSGSGDNMLRVWDLQTGKYLRILEGHIFGVVAVVITPDGCRAVSGSRDGTLRVWDIQTGKCLRILEGHSGSVYVVGITPDGHTAILGISDRDNTIRVWNLRTGEFIAIYSGNDPISSVSMVNKKGDIVIGTSTGLVIFARIMNPIQKSPVITATRLWLFDPGSKKGIWDDKITALCEWCGKCFVVSGEILDVIRSISRNARLSPDDSPCLKLPDEAFNDPRLLSACPHCHQPLKFNPFVVDNKERY